MDVNPLMAVMAALHAKQLQQQQQSPQRGDPGGYKGGEPPWKGSPTYQGQYTPPVENPIIAQMRNDPNVINNLSGPTGGKDLSYLLAPRQGHPSPTPDPANWSQDPNAWNQYNLDNNDKEQGKLYGAYTSTLDTQPKAPKAHDPMAHSLLPMLIGGVLSYLAGGSDRGASTAAFANSFMKTRQQGAEVQDRQDQLQYEHEQAARQDKLRGIQALIGKAQGDENTIRGLMAQEAAIRRELAMKDHEHENRMGEIGLQNAGSQADIKLRGENTLSAVDMKELQTHKGWENWYAKWRGDLNSPIALAERAQLPVSSKDANLDAKTTFIGGAQTDESRARTGFLLSRTAAQDITNSFLPKTLQGKINLDAKRVEALQSDIDLKPQFYALALAKLGIAQQLADATTADKPHDNAFNLWTVQTAAKLKPLQTDHAGNFARMQAIAKEASKPYGDMDAIMDGMGDVEAGKAVHKQHLKDLADEYKILEGKNTDLQKQMDDILSSFKPPEPQAPGGGAAKPGRSKPGGFDTSGSFTPEGSAPLIPGTVAGRDGAQRDVSTDGSGKGQRLSGTPDPKAAFDKLPSIVRNALQVKDLVNKPAKGTAKKGGTAKVSASEVNQARNAYRAAKTPAEKKIVQDVWNKAHKGVPFPK